MDVEQRPPYQLKIPDEDWEGTPLSVRQLVNSQSERLGQLEERLGQLEQQLADIQGDLASQEREKQELDKQVKTAMRMNDENKR